MKRIISLTLCILLLCSLSPAVSADLPKIVDEAELLTADQIQQLEKKAQSLTDQYGMDVVILTVDSLGNKESDEYADDYYDDHGYGIGSDSSGLILVLSMEYRDWAISTCGQAIYAITDYGVYDIFTKIAPYLSENRFYEAFDRYLDELDTYFYSYTQNDPIDGTIGDYDGPGSFIPGDRDDVMYYPEPFTFMDGVRVAFVSLLIGCVVGGIVLLVLRSGMKTAKRQSGANNYLKQGTFDLRRRHDIFLYSNVSRVRRDTDSGGGGHRGGSSIHRSSGGRSHGGGRGKF